MDLDRELFADPNNLVMFWYRQWKSFIADPFQNRFFSYLSMLTSSYVLSNQWASC